MVAPAPVVERKRPWLVPVLVQTPLREPPLLLVQLLLLVLRFLPCLVLVKIDIECQPLVGEVIAQQLDLVLILCLKRLPAPVVLAP